MTSQRPAEPWRIHFFRRHRADDPAETVPVRDWLDGLPVRVAAEIPAVLDAVAAAGPPAFSGGGKWRAMHGEMAGFYEIRVRGGGQTIVCSACSSGMRRISAGQASCASWA
jgi:hypothetical protein